MKKFLPIICVSVLLVSCNAGQSEEKDVTFSTIKEVINSFSTAPYKVKGYEVSFNESYSMTGTNKDEEESSSYSINYHAEGEKKYSYSLDDNVEDNILPIDIISTGNGFYYAKQREVSEYECHEYDKDNQVIYSDSSEVIQNHTIAIGFDDNNFKASGSETYAGHYLNKDDVTMAHIFEGKIDKSSLIKELSNRLTEKALASISFTDAMNYVDEIDDFFLAMIPEIKNYNENQLKDFIKNNKVTVKKESGNIRVNLNYDASTLATLFDIEKVSNIYINTELLIDKDGQILNFKYDLKDFLLNLVKGEQDSNVTFVEDTLVFNVEGKLLRTILEDIYISESNEYDDVNAYINDFFARGLPYKEAN